MKTHIISAAILAVITASACHADKGTKTFSPQVQSQDTGKAFVPEFCYHLHATYQSLRDSYSTEDWDTKHTANQTPRDDQPHTETR